MGPLIGWFDGLEPYVRLSIHGETVTLLVDSGFTGDLWLPAETLGRFGWPPVSTTVCTLANGEEVEQPLHRGSLTLLGADQPVWAIAGEGPTALIGMHLLRRARIELRPAQRRVVISPDNGQAGN